APRRAPVGRPSGILAGDHSWADGTQRRVDCADAGRVGLKARQERALRAGATFWLRRSGLRASDGVGNQSPRTIRTGADPAVQARRPTQIQRVPLLRAADSAPDAGAAGE